MSQEFKEAVPGSIKPVGKPTSLAGESAQVPAAPKKVRKSGAERQAAYIDRKRAAEDKVAHVYNNQTEPTRKEALKILASRGIRNQHVIETCYELALVAAEELKIPCNAFLLRNGVQQALVSYEMSGRQPLPEIEDVWYPGERIRLRDQHALWDFSTAWRTQPDGTKISFDEFKRLRRMCITDTYEFGRQILGKDFHPEPHGRWAKELFVQKNPDLLPEIYDQEDIKKALAGQSEIQSEIHQRLLISARNSYKSTYNVVDLISWVLLFNGEIRILMISSTIPLSRGFLKSFRAYFTVKNPHAPTLFNQLYPEHMIAFDEGAKTSFTSPMRQLDLIQPTLTSSSLDSEGLAGERADILCFEDVAEISNSSNPEQREKTLEKYDLLRELLEPQGFLQVIGTPISTGDVYSTILEREKLSSKAGLLHQINPAWQVKPGIKKEAYDKTLTEDEVILLFPSRLTFDHLKRKLNESVKTFRQQSLCSWVPDEDSELKVTFDEDVIRHHLRPISFFSEGVVLSVCTAMDEAFSLSGIADLTAIVTAKLIRFKGKEIMVVIDVDADRWRLSEKASHLVDAVIKHNSNKILIEKSASHEALHREINRVSMIMQFAIGNIYWKSPTVGGPSQKSKNLRIKSMEAEFQNDRLWLATGSWNDIMIDQYLRFNGNKSSGSKKDDIIDATGMLCAAYLPRFTEEEKSSEQTQIEEESAKRERLLAFQRRMFGDIPGTPQPRPAESVEQEDFVNPLFRGTGSYLKRR